MTPKAHLLTVGLEDYFQVGAFHRVIQHGKWYRFETRLEHSTLKTLELLDQFDIKATFFVLGWIADTAPEIVREVAQRGHEIANRGYYHQSVRHMNPSEFREDLLRSQEALENASGKRILGYRVGRQWFTRSDFWILDILAEEGYAYDSSLIPLLRSFRAEPWRRFAHRHQSGDKVLWEFPFSTWDCLGWWVPIAGGNYFRQLPHGLVKRAVETWHRKYETPFVMYFHVWELDLEQPRISAASALAKLRHYRNLGKMRWVLSDYFERYRFVSIADHLGLDTSLHRGPICRKERTLQPHFEIVPPASGENLHVQQKLSVSVVVPCFNEQPTLPYLANTLQQMEENLGKRYAFTFIFVDDCSTDRTWKTLQTLFGSKPNCMLMQHEHNLGVAAAILTGLRHAATDVVCSMDCDCTYDPHDLSFMIDMLTEEVDVVTASPYHPAGEVQNVPAWRLVLSKTASFLYRQVLHQKLYTYTSCCRVYRKRAIVDLCLKHDGFLGVAEMLGRLDLQGAHIVEYPATLEVRMLGQSKIKVLKTIVGHVWLLAHLLVLRLRHQSDPGGRCSKPERIAPQTRDVKLQKHLSHKDGR